MFPTTHDIFPGNLAACLVVLVKLLMVGNNVLIVSKPRLQCIKDICQTLSQYKSQILFRFTIGSAKNEILSTWEPNAPAFEERLESLQYAYQQGFQTSVSAEPMLDAENVESLVIHLTPLVTESIWLGKMNHVGPKFIANRPHLRNAVMAVKNGQTDEKIKAIHSNLKDHPLVKWKDSIKKVIGLRQPVAVGLDI